MDKKSTRIEITDQMHSTLLEELERTGTGPQMLCRGNREEKPKGLNSATLYQIIKRVQRSVKASYWNYWMGRLKALPDKEQAFIALTDTNRAKLRDRLAATGVSSRKSLFVGRTDIPAGFKMQHLQIMTQIQPGTQKQIEREYYEFVERLCDEYMKERKIAHSQKV